MKIEYDENVDALAISFTKRPRSARTTTVAKGINLDFDAKGKLVVIEILDASRFTSADNLRKLDSAREDLTLAQASKESGLAADTLRSLIHKKRLPATKEGRDWKVSLADLYANLDSRDARAGDRKRELAHPS